MVFTNADIKELEKYEDKLEKRAFFGKHAGVITGIVFVALAAGVLYLLLS